VTYIGNKDHSACGNKIEKGLDFTVVFKRTTDIFAISFVLRKRCYQYEHIWAVQASNPALHPVVTCLDIPDKKSATRSLALYAFFNNGIMNFVITFAADIDIPSRSSAKASVVIIGVGDF
jgi:hypothetical protein